MSSERSTVSVKNLSTEQKLKLIEALWNNQSPASFFVIQKRSPPPYIVEEARKLFDDGYIDYLCGRALKLNTTGDMWNLSLYNRDIQRGNPTGEQVFASMNYSD